MKRLTRAIVVSAEALILTGALAVAGTAAAAFHQRDVAQSATGSCAAAMSHHDTHVRKRPLAMQNDGTLPALASCPLSGTARGVGGVRSTKAVYLDADNNTALPQVMTCTLVDRVSGYVGTYLPRTRVLPPHSTLSEFYWAAADNGGLNFAFAVNNSCSLPVGTGLSVMLTVYDKMTDA